MPVSADTVSQRVGEFQNKLASAALSGGLLGIKLKTVSVTIMPGAGMSERGNQGTVDPARQQRTDHHASTRRDKADQLRWPDCVLGHEQLERDPCRETGRNGEHGSLCIGPRPV